MKSSEELIQVLAVGVSILEDLRHGVADNSQAPGAVPIISEIYEERDRQDAKWGPQHHTPEEWAMILVEEMGEWAGEILAEHLTRPRTMSGSAWFILCRLHYLESEARRWLEFHDFDEPS